VKNTDKTAEPADDSSASSHRPEAGERRSDSAKVILVVNSVIAAVGGTYASTHSVTVTIAAGCAGLAAAVLAVRN
jgi:L-serine deaminase